MVLKPGVVNGGVLVVLKMELDVPVWPFVVGCTVVDWRKSVKCTENENCKVSHSCMQITLELTSS